MKHLRTFVTLLLLAIAAPIAIPYRAWSLGIPAVAPAGHRLARSAEQPRPSVELTATQLVVSETARSEAPNSDVANASLDLPAASSSLPLLSVIGFGIFIGGLISAVRTRPAHK